MSFPPSKDGGFIEGMRRDRNAVASVVFPPSKDGGFIEGRWGNSQHAAPPQTFPPSKDGGFIEGRRVVGMTSITLAFPPSKGGGFIEGPMLCVGWRRAAACFHHRKMVASLRV